MIYAFETGQRVCMGSRVGEVESMVPGNGSIEWYYVRWDDGGYDRYTRDDLTAA